MKSSGVTVQIKALQKNSPMVVFFIRILQNEIWVLAVFLVEEDLNLLFLRLSTNHDPDIICVDRSGTFEQEEISSVLQDLF